jgi:transposase
MGWLVLGLRPAVENAACGVTQKRYGNTAQSRNVLRARQWQRSDRNGGACAHEKVLIGVDPHQASVAIAAIDEASGELLERASFPQNSAGLRSLECWAKRFGERRWAVENSGGLGRHLAGRLAAAGECVVDVPPKLSARVRVLSSFAGNARKNDGLDALATALAASRNGRLAAVDPEIGSEVLRLLSERREDLVAERTRALNRLHGLLRDLLPCGVAGTLSAHRAARILRGIRPQGGASASLRQRLASEILRDVRTLDRKIADLSGRIEAEVEASGTTLTKIFGVGPMWDPYWPPRSSVRSATWRASRPRATLLLTLARRRWKPPAARWCATGSRWPATAGSTMSCTWPPSARPGRKLGAEPTTARRSRRANLVRRRCGASRGASLMPFSGASWRIRSHLRAAPLDKEEPRITLPRTRVNRGVGGLAGTPRQVK